LEGPLTVEGDITVEPASPTTQQALINLAGNGSFNYSGFILWNNAYTRYWSFLHRNQGTEEGSFKFEYFNGSTYNVFFELTKTGVFKAGPNLSRVILAENIGTGLTWDSTNNLVKNCNIPLNMQNAAYTFVAGDAGKAVGKDTLTARIYTVPQNTFNAGDVITVFNNNAGGNISIAAGTGVTVRLAGTATSGTRTVAPYGVATIFFVTANVALVSGAGVT